MSSSPAISALLTTFNRAEYLPRVMEALTEQSLPEDQFEVVVIDDGSSDETREIAQAFSRRQANIRYAYQQNSGLASARNHGIFLCRSPLLVFLDDDDVPSHKLLEQHLSAHLRHSNPTDAILGYTGLAPAIAVDPLMRFVTEVDGLLFWYRDLEHGDVLDYRWFWGGRTSCKRALLIEHGIFDPVFRFGCEDVELGYRLSAVGLRVIYDATARTTMIRSIDFDAFIRRRRLQGESQYLFSQRHLTPEILSYTRAAEGLAEWKRVEPMAEALVASARHLDRFARQEMAEGFQFDSVTENLVHAAYRRAFHVANIQGMAAQASALKAGYDVSFERGDAAGFLSC